VEAHYESQVWEIEVPVEVERFRGPQDVQRVRRAFDRVHEEIFSFHDPGSEVQFICWRAAASCKLAKGGEGNLVSSMVVRADAPVSRPAYFAQVGKVETPIVQFGLMQSNRPLDGPAIVESPFTTVVIEPNSRVVRTESGSLLITAECTLQG
jgi:N-methylhydantoinase A